MTRDFAPLDERLEAAAARLRAIPAFLDDGAPRRCAAAPDAWRDKALRECDGRRARCSATACRAGGSLDGRHGDRSPRCRSAAAARGGARRRSTRFRSVARARRRRRRADGADRVRPELLRPAAAARPLVRRRRSTTLLARGARRARRGASAELDERARRSRRAAGRRSSSGWPHDHPTPRRLSAARSARLGAPAASAAIAADLVTWPDAPIRYVPIPGAHARRRAVPLLPVLPLAGAVRSAAGSRLRRHADRRRDAGRRAASARLRATNDSVITLNHVVHHGGDRPPRAERTTPTRGASRIGQVAAVDCASRIACSAAARWPKAGPATRPT